ncbi:hypothetical protein RYX36_014526, partial [Vicia faba]
MPSVAVKLYSVFFKFLLKHRLQNRIQAQPDNNSNSFGITSRPEESVANSNPSFTDGVATKDIHIDPFTSLSIRIFLPHSALSPPEPHSKPNSKPKQQAPEPGSVWRSSYGPPFREEQLRGRNSNAVEGLNLMGAGVETGAGLYRGYSPALDNRRRKLPVMLQFHGGGWVSGSNDSVANDLFCRRIAKLCDVIVVAVGYRLAPESRYPAAFEDGLKVLNWLAKQANLAECSKSMGVGGGSHGGGGGGEFNKDNHRHIVDSFGASVVEPWLASHGDPTRHAFATAAIAPFAIVLERKIRPRITFLMFMQMFVLGLLGPVIDQNLYYAGLKFTSPTYSSSIKNLQGVVTFKTGIFCKVIPYVIASVV